MGKLLGVAFFILNIIDMVATYFFLTNYPSSFMEANPLMRFIIENAGWAVVFTIKITIGLLTTALLIATYKRLRLAKYGLWFIFTTYLSVDVIHLYLYLTHAR